MILPPAWTAVPAALIFLLIQAPSFVRFAASQPGSIGWSACVRLASLAVDLGFVLLLLFGLAALGRRALHRYGLLRGSRALQILFGLALAQGALAFGLLGLGLLGWIGPGVLALLYCAIGFAAWRDRWEAAEQFKKLGKFLRGNLRPFDWLLAVVLFAALARAVVSAAAPPTDWDSLAYHLAFPKIFLAEGRFFRLPWSINAHYPLNSEMLYLLAMGLRGATAAHLLNVAHFALVIATLIVAARRWMTGRFALLAAAVFAAQDVAQRVTGNGSTDPQIAWLSMLAVLAFWLASDEDDARLYALSGMLAGLAMSAKITGTWTALAIGAALLWPALRTQSAKPLLLFAVPCALAGAPWYLKNWLWTGNPVWPYLGEWFGANAADLGAWHRIRASVTEGVAKTALNFAALPYHWIADGGRFHYSTRWLTLPFLALLFARFAARIAAPFEKKLASYLILFTACWFFVYQDWRYFLPAIPWLCLLSAFWAGKLWERGGRLKWAPSILAVAFVPLANLSANNELFALFQARSSQAGISPDQRYLQLHLGAPYGIALAANERLPENAKVLFYRDVRGYYWDRRYAWGDPLNPGVVDFAEAKDAQDLRGRLLAQGFTHVYFNPLIGDYRGDPEYYARADRMMEEMLKDGIQPALRLNEQAVYALTGTEAGGTGISPQKPSE